MEGRAFGDPRVSNQRDKRLPPEQIGADLNPGAYYYPVTVDPSESTYQGGTGFGGPWDPQPEPVIDGSNIPSTIDFPAPREYTPPTDENGIITDRSFNLFDINNQARKHLR